jgi:hypothetical protein
MKARTWHFDAALSALFAAACAWMFWVSRQEAASAVRQYGYNVDSGAPQYALAIVFLMPVTLLFGLAAIAGASEWRLSRYVHWLAIVAAVCPIAGALFVAASS